AVGDHTHDLPRCLAWRRNALALFGRVLVARDALAPAAVEVLSFAEPARGAADVRGAHVFTDAAQAAQNLPGTVDVVHAPASVPATFGRLIAAEEVDRAVDGRMGTRIGGKVGEAFEHATGDVGGAGIDHRVVIGEGDLRQP